MMMIAKESEYKLASYQRTKFSFVKAIAESITWPFHCLSGFIDNSLEAFEAAKIKHELAKA
jgi:hypothetical protein